MRASEIIRGVLDLIDQIDCNQESESSTTIEIGTLDTEKINNAPNTIDYNDETRRFKQIIDILTSEPHQMYDNSPGEAYTKADAMTIHAGGGLNGPKHPSDIRADSISMFPNFQAKG